MEIVSGIVGFIVGAVTSGIVSNCKSKAGVLRIDHSDPEKDRYLFDIEDLDKLSSRKRIVLQVDNNADLSNSSQD